MSTAPTSAGAGFQQAQLANRLHMHLVASASSMGGTLLAGGTVLWTLWGHFVHPLAAAGWFLALAVAMSWRLMLRRRHLPLAGSADASAMAAAVTQFRVAFVLHGVIWASLPAMLAHPMPAAQQVALVFMVVAMVGASLVVNGFDLPAAAGFCLPTALPIAAYLLVGDDSAVRGLPAIASLFVLMMGLTGWRIAQLTDAGVRNQLTAQERTAQSLQLAEQADQARRGMAEQHALLQQVLHTTQQGFCVLDTQGVVTDHNHAMARLLGRAAEAVQGQVLTTLLDPAAARRLAGALEQARIGQASRTEMELLRGDGSAAPCLALITPMLDEQGRHCGSFALWTDLSGVRLRERERLNSAWALDSMADGVAVFDAPGQTLLVNDAWTRSCGGHLDGAVREAVAACLADGAPQVATLESAEDGQVARTYDLRCRPFRDPVRGHPCVVATLRDVTPQARAQGELEATAEALRRTLNAIGDGVFASDAVNPSQPVRFVNDQLLRLWNIPLDRAAGLTPAQILEASLPQMLEPQREMARIREIVEGNLADQQLVRLKDGRVLARRCEPAEATRRPLRVWTFRDVTTRERALALLQHRDAEQQALLDAFPGLIARFDDALRLRWANEGLAHALGCEAASLQGLSVAELAERGLVLPPPAALAAVRLGTPMVVEQRLGHGEPARHVQLTLAASTDVVSGAPVLVVFGVDISERHRAEAALAAARDHAQQADHAKGRFLSQLSHELRTPLHAIDGFSQLLLGDRRSALNGLQREWVDQICEGTRHLTSLLDDLLDLGRAEAGRLPMALEAVPVDGLLTECQELTASLAARRGLQGPTVTAGPDGRRRSRCQVLADRMRLKQVLLNLLSNAIKYNRPGGHVELAVHDLGAQVELVVRDTGPGLDAQAQARLFMPFERLDADRQGIAGTGIGLALSRQLVEAMGGRIGVRSRLGVGSEFWLTLDAASEGHDMTGPITVAGALDDGGPAANALPRSRRALLVDPQPLDRALIEMVAEDVTGLRLQCTDNGAQALAMALAEPPDLLLVAWQLPDGDAASLLRQLRSQPRTRGVRVIALGRPGGGERPDDAPAAGFSGWLDKPLDTARVLDALVSGTPQLAGGLQAGSAQPRATLV